MKKLRNWIKCKFTSNQCDSAVTEYESFDFVGCWATCSKCKKTIR